MEECVNVRILECKDAQMEECVNVQTEVPYHLFSVSSDLALLKKSLLH